MSVTTYSSARDFLDVAGPFLATDPLTHNVILGVANRLSASDGDDGPSPFFAIARQGHGPVTGVVMQTPPRHLVVSGDFSSAAVLELGRKMEEAGLEIPGVHGPRPAVTQVANALANQRSLGLRTAVAMRLFKVQASDLASAPTVAGSFRWATVGDHRLLGDWWLDFFREAVPHEANVAKREQVIARINSGDVAVWVAEDRPVSMAVRGRQIGTGATVGPVYTPPHQRRQGFGQALTHALTSAILATPSMAFACLFTDETNATSNAIYQAIGYKQVGEAATLDFV